MRSIRPVAAAVAVALGLVSAAATAQTHKGSYPSAPQADRSQQRGYAPPSYDPNAETERELRRLGLKPNKPLGATGAEGAGPTEGAAGAGLLRRLDTDHDGTISREEYVRGRVPSGRIGSAVRTRTDVARSRSIARFRSADRDRNGRLTRDELDRVRDPRF